MNPLKLHFFPDSTLTKVCEPVERVTPSITQLAKDMLLTMMVERGVGLAAPQIGKAIRMFVVDVKWPQGAEKGEPFVFINPTVTMTGPDTPSTEGCLSFPGARATLTRSSTVHVSALDMNGEPFTLEADGLLAMAIQHENDHLDGKTVNAALNAFDRKAVMKNIKKKVRGR